MDANRKSIVVLCAVQPWLSFAIQIAIGGAPMKLYLLISAPQPLIQGTLPSFRFNCVTKNRAESRPLYSSSPSRPSTGVIVPKRPSCSPLMPAVKNRVLAGPAVPSLPKVSDHKPSMVRMESSGFFTKPKNL